MSKYHVNLLTFDIKAMVKNATISKSTPDIPKVTYTTLNQAAEQTQG